MNDKIEEKAVILPPFKHMIMTIGELPSSYVETMTYYEMLVWFTNYLGKTVIPAINENGEAVIELQDLFVKLQTYVNDYFDNLDVQEEINNKLDAMAESGQLTDIIAQYLGLAGMIAFDTVADMKLAENLVNGSKCHTLGFNSVNDNGSSLYKIRTKTIDDVVDESTIISLYDENLVAEKINENVINIKSLGIENNDDASSVIENDKEYFISDDTTILINKEQILNNENIKGNGNIKWKDFTTCEKIDGIVPISLKNDDIYKSMNFPDDANTYIERVGNGSVDNTIASNTFRILPICSIYVKDQAELPDDFTVKIGKVKLFGYRGSTKKWETLVESIPFKAALYALPWTVSNVVDITDIGFDETDNNMILHLHASDFAPNPSLGIVSRVIHFWGGDYFPGENDYLDLENFATGIEARAFTEDGTEITDKLLLASAIDSRLNSENGTIVQYNATRLEYIKPFKKSFWSYTCSNQDYINNKNWKHEIEQLMNAPINTQQQVRRLILPANNDKTTSALLKIGSVPIVLTTFNITFNVQINYAGSSSSSYLIYNLRITRQNNNTYVDFVQVSHSSRSGVLKVIVNTEANTYDIYVSNIPQYDQCIIDIEPIVYNKPVVVFNITPELLRTYNTYDVTFKSLWLSEAPAGTSYSNS